MPRLPVLRRRDLRADQAVVWDQITGGPRAAAHQSMGGLGADDAGLVGPFNAWVTSPALGGPAGLLGEAVRFRSTLDRRVLELVVLVVAVHYRVDFEFWAHERYAVEAGVTPALVASIVAGSEPVDASEDDRAIVACSREILRTGRLERRRYDALLGVLGAAGVVDLVTTLGFYCLVSFNLNVFDVPAPDGYVAPWPPFGADGEHAAPSPHERRVGP